MQDETIDAISEAAAILKSWNNKWKPLVFMVDNCEEEINAIEEHFPGSNINPNLGAGQFYAFLVNSL